MKHIFFALIFISGFFLMLLFPSETLYGATNGLLLWFQILVPTLVPFLILTNLLLQTNAVQFITRYFRPIFQRLFHVSANGSFAIISGFLCGYPVGAKVTADLVKSKKISLTEGNYLLSFCNNTSPAFVSSYIVLQQLKEPSLLIPSLLILYLSSILCSFIFRYFYKIKTISSSTYTYQTYFSFQMLDNAIMNAFETITKIGGYMMLFSIVFTFGKNTPLNSFLPFLEITMGISHILSKQNRFIFHYTYIMTLTSFGGICSIAQTNSVIQGSGLSIYFYTIEKLITALVTSLLSFSYVTIILG